MLSDATARSSATLQVAVREMRLIFERILLAAGVPEGLVPAVRECAVASAAVGLGGFEMLCEEHERIGAESKRALQLDQTGTTTTLDAQGQHAWLVAPAALDIAVDIAAIAGAGHLELRNVRCARELGVMEGLAHRHGARATVTAGTDHATVSLTIHRPPQSLQTWDPVLHRAVHSGVAVDSDLWWELHRMSARALAPDSVASRRHAGPVIV
ncbi:MAG TPA: hypothetical protein VFC24_14350, partial [Casimicrobiaceae bacterium]|nr:hypothetical protein [Casimicrobiaceae bacterium]